MDKPNDPLGQVTAGLSARLQQLIRSLPGQVKNTIQEIRLRKDRPVVLRRHGQPYFLQVSARLTQTADASCITVDALELEQVFQRLCAYSVHSFQSQIRAGYITLSGGHRVGICGQAVVENGLIVSVKNITSLCIRISRAFPGAADEVIARADPSAGGGILLAGPPCCGKTTILRDMARQLSTKSSVQVALIDEKGELSGGEHPGLCCDVMYGYPKAEGIQQAIRNLAPQLIICDEIGTRGELIALAEGFHAGVNVAASVHACSLQELYTRPVVQSMLESGGFDRVVLLCGGANVGKIKDIYRVEAKQNENYGTDFSLCQLYGRRMDEIHAAG